jgi:hypothetical protein
MMRHIEALLAEDLVDVSRLGFLVRTQAPTPILWAIGERAGRWSVFGALRECVLDAASGE